MPPECWKTQLLAHVCALAARSSLHVSAAAPCCARTVLCAVRYALMSLCEVAPSEDEDEEELVVWACCVVDVFFDVVWTLVVLGVLVV